MSRHATARKPSPTLARRVSGAAQPATRPGRHGPLRPLPASAPARAVPVVLPAGGRTTHVLDRLLRSRAWIWLIGLMLGGIVAMQVSLLKLNAGISRAVESAATLERQNAELQSELAHLSSGERIREAAAKLGMVAPDAGTVGYLTSRGEADARRALNRMTPPSAEARELLANKGRVPEGGAGVTAVTATTPTTTAATPAQIATPEIQSSPQPVATAQATPSAPEASATGGAAAGQG